MKVKEAKEQKEAKPQEKTPAALANKMPEGMAELAPEIDQSIINQRCQRHDWRVLFDKKIDFTKEVAMEFIEKNEFEAERPLRDDHVEALVQHAKNGTFLLEQAALADCLCKFDGSTRRLNGHHTCWMRHYMPDDWTPKIRHVRYEVQTEDEFRTLYSLFDRNAPRSAGHVTQSRLFGSEKYKGISKRALSYAKNGLSYWLWGNDHSERMRHRIDEIVTLMETDHYQLCYDVATFINGLPNSESFMSRGSVSGAVFATFARAKGDADKFWSSVRSGLGMAEATDPRKVLRDYLQTKKVVGANSYTKKDMVPSEAMYRACIHAWNAWRKGEQLHQINAPLASKVRPAVK